MNLIKYKKNPIISPRFSIKFEKECTYNPSAVIYNNNVFLIYRAEGKYGDYISKLCLAKSNDGFKFRRYNNNPVIEPSLPEEERGCEDPRITKIEDVFYLTYTSFKGRNPSTKKNIINLSLAISKDLINWKKKGIILENMKAGVIHSEKINGKYIMFVGEGDIKIARSKDLKEWKFDKDSLLKPRNNFFENRIVEIGPNPITLEDKIILFFNTSNKKREYFVSYSILDRRDPSKVLYRHNKPILFPTEQFERFGKVNNVIFLEGIVEFKNKYFLYYGGADKCIGVATISKKDLIKTISKNLISRH